MLDFIGMALSLLATYYSVKMDVKTWPFSLMAILVNTYLYWNVGLFGQGILELMYIASILYGWWFWNHSQSKKPVQNISSTHAILLSILTPITVYGMSTVIFQKTQSEIAFWDASVMVLSLAAQWLLCQRILQCWMLWFVVDIMVCVIHWYKGLPFHSLLHIVYLGMAVMGYRSWRTKLNEQELPLSWPESSTETKI